jgi:DNA helicase-2/ATP-dependent DNA helicase PcrA
LLDYDDLMLYSLALLQKDNAVLDTLRKYHRYILVDEFQDTNSLQAHIVETLAGDTGNLTVVGDECQGIYSFRGANPRSILQFPVEFPLAKVHTLTRNYRSTQPILEVANQLMAHSPESFGKHLSAASMRPPEKPVLAHCVTFEDQAVFVAERIRQLHEEGISLDHIAVLFRSASHSAELEIALQRKSIPFKKFGGIRFVEASHIKDMVALLRLVANPRDGISWQRVLLLLPGVGSATAQGILERMDHATKPYEVLTDSAFKGRKFAIHLNTLADWFSKTSPERPPADLLESALLIARPWLEDHYVDDAPKRLADLQTLIHIAQSAGPLETFLSELSLDPPEHTGVVDSSIDMDQNLTLSTIHSAKGLEWRVVFVLSLLEGSLPSYFSLRSQSQIEEERRLFYVAITRAERELYVCLPENAFLTNSKIQEIGIPSRFLDDIPEDLWDHWDIEN